MKKIGIIGAGVVGTAIGVILSDLGYEVTGIFDRDPESTVTLAEKTKASVCSSPETVARSSEILFITTTDVSIGEVVGQIARADGFKPGQVVIHMSGALSSDVLDPARKGGALVVSVHPMQSFASAERAVKNLPGSVFSIEGDQGAFEIAAELVKDLQGDYFFIDQKSKPLYHAGACVVSNYLVTLIDLGLQMLESIGIPRNKALRAFLPLINGTLNNIENIGVPRALTGPIARGDLSTVVRHLDCLEKMAPQLIILYSLLGYYTTEVARAKGTIDQGAAEQFKRVFLDEVAASSTVGTGVDL